MFIKIVKTLIFLIILSGYREAIAHEVCKSGAKITSLQACYDASVLKITYENSLLYQFDRQAFEDAWRSQIQLLLQAEDTSLEIYPMDLKYTLWLAVPEADPTAVQARIVVESNIHPKRFVIFAPMDPTQAVMDLSHVGVLDSGYYPDTFGYRAGVVLLKVDTTTKQETLDAVLSGAGYAHPQYMAPGYYKLSAAAFKEQATQQSIKRDEYLMQYIQDVNTVAIYEWLADRFAALTWQ